MSGVLLLLFIPYKEGYTGGGSSNFLSLLFLISYPIRDADIEEPNFLQIPTQH